MIYFQRLLFYLLIFTFIKLLRRRHLENVLHLIVEENNLIVLSNNDTIVIYFNETAEHIHKLSLLSGTFEVISISLIKSSCKEVNEHDCYKLIKHHSDISIERDVRIGSNTEVYLSNDVCDELYVLVVTEHCNGC